MDYAIGIDLGGTSIKYALVDSDGHSSAEGRMPSLASVSAEAVIGQLVKAAALLKEEAAVRGCSLKGIGLGTPGIVDETGRIVLGGAENIAGWENLDVASALEAELHLPVCVGNDANLMGLGETRYGAGRGCSHVLFLTVGTGIGGAVVIDGKLFGGYANRGTELGHVPLMANGERCACGATGCLEHYASTTALVRRFTALAKEQGLLPGTEGGKPASAASSSVSPVVSSLSAASCLKPGTRIDGELIVRLYHEQFPLAVRCMEEHFYYLGRGIAGFINIFSPQRVVVGGGIVDSGAFYIEKVRQQVRGQVIPDCAVNTEIVAASLGNRAGLIGAASLILL